MKKIISILVVFLLTLSLTACGEADLKILIPTEYLAEELVADFQKMHKIKIKTVPFVSNEAAITKLKMEKFDLIVPSDYAVEQLVAEDLIIPLDWDNITSVNKETSFPESLIQIIDSYESSEVNIKLLDYMVPYFWGNLGIVYDSTKPGLKEALENEQWGIFTDASLERVIYDSSRDAFFMALRQLGYSANTKNISELTAAEQYLNQIADTPKVYFLTDEILDDMQTLRYDVALTYNGDAVYLMERQPKVGYYVPTNGTNVFVDGLSIPKNSRNIDLAYKFINFVLEYDNAVINTIDVTYVSAIKEVYEHMLNDTDSHFYKLRDVYRVEMRENDEIFHFVPEAKRFMDDAWTRIRTR